MLRQHGAELPVLPSGMFWDALRTLPVPAKVRRRLGRLVVGGAAQQGVALP